MKDYLRVLFFAFVASAAVPGHAQTTANGPYYATPSWDQTLPAASRFVVLSNFANGAVLDRETGLVWWTTDLGSYSYNGVQTLCSASSLGGRYGWRIPTYAELLSINDNIGATGSPFNYGKSNGIFYWSATPAWGYTNTINLWSFVGEGAYGSAGVSAHLICVRGGSQAGG
jgi:hypothetical protein